VCTISGHYEAAKIPGGSFCRSLDELVLETGRGDVKRKQMTKMKIYFGVVVYQVLFGPREELVTPLQATNTTAVRVSNVLLVHFRNDDEFNYVYTVRTEGR